MGKFEQKTIDFSSGEPGKHHYCQWTPEHPAAWLHIMHGMSEHGIRYRGLAQFLNQHGIMVTAGDHRGHGQTGEAMASNCLLYTSPSPRDRSLSRMPSSA